jgi:hypothetical protein
VTAFDADGDAIAAGQVSAAAPACPPVLPPPDNLRFEPASEPGAVLVRWDAERHDLGYEITVEESGVHGSDHTDLSQPVGTEPLVIVPIRCGTTLDVTVAATAADGTAYPPMTGTYHSDACAAWEVLGEIQTVVSEAVDTEPGKITSAAVACPDGHSLLGGGFAVSTSAPFDVPVGSDRPFVIGNRPSGNGWEVQVAVPPESGFAMPSPPQCPFLRSVRARPRPNVARAPR